MDELSLNSCLIPRNEVYQWEFVRSVGRCLGVLIDDSLRGLFNSSAAFVGTRRPVEFDLPQEQLLPQEAVTRA